MYQLMTILLDIILPIIVISGIGFMWVKKGYDFPRPFVTNLIMNIGAPCLIFTAMMSFSDNVEQASHFMIVAVSAILFFLLFSFIFVYATGLPKRAFLLAFYSRNCGNMGVPICYFAFGDAGMALALVFLAVSIFFQYTVGLAISHGNLSFKTVAQNTFLYGFIAALIFLFFEIKPPVWVTNTSELLGQMTIPLMLIMLGTSLATFQISSSYKLIILSVIKVGMGLIIGVLTAHLFDLEGVERNVLIMQMTMPVAVFSYMLAAKFNRSPDEVAGMVFFTTLISFVTMPVILSFML